MSQQVEAIPADMVRFGPPPGRGPLLGFTTPRLVVAAFVLVLTGLIFITWPNPVGGVVAMLFLAAGGYAVVGRFIDRSLADWLPMAIYFVAGKLTGTLRWESTRPWRAIVTAEPADAITTVQLVTTKPAPEKPAGDAAEEKPMPRPRARHRQPRGEVVDLPTNWEGPLAGIRLLGWRRAGQSRSTPDMGVIAEGGRCYRVMLDVTGGHELLLLDDAEQLSRFDEWGDLLASCVRPGSVLSCIQTIVQLAEDFTTDSAAYVRNRAVLAENHPARESLEEFGDEVQPTQRRRRIFLVLEVDTGAAAAYLGRANGGGDFGACAVLAKQVEEFTGDLEVAHIHVNEILTGRGVAEAMRSIIDPYSGRAVAQRQDAGGEPGVDPGAVEPDTIEWRWRMFRADEACSVGGYVREWPQQAMNVTGMADIYLEPMCCYTVAVPMRPVPRLAAKDQSRSALAKGEAADDLREQKGFSITPARFLARRSQQEMAWDLAEGARVYGNNLFVLVSGRDELEAEAAWSEVEDAAVNSGLELSRFWGQQPAGLAAVLPLCRGV